MAKIDTSAIENYASMTAEEKLAALEAYEFEDNSALVEKQKNAISKANSDAAEWKRKYQAQLSEDEKAKQEQEDELASLRTEVATLRKTALKADYQSKFLATGYSDDLADKAAQAFVDGDLAKFMTIHGQFVTEHEKSLKAELMKNTPVPGAGSGTSTMTREQFNELDFDAKLQFYKEHPDEYKEFYKTKGE